ncbi:hypothetical protein SADUNF_Sadunf14G0033000 [Salix dunnii]|uniref:Uncharacterized protein n=1 Tax=Salix dunnii TaxID=1413687 RepID=A0A835MPL5_9ROSI|nr:hypothetical protein SADUNF_Sadunf14G0033000 [Salix dunnii]
MFCFSCLQCWLRKQDTLEPDQLDSGDPVMWTSGLVFGRGEVHYSVKVLWVFQCLPNFSSSTAANNVMVGKKREGENNYVKILRNDSSWTSMELLHDFPKGIIGLETEYGTLHLKLLPGCAPHSISYILDLLVWHHRLGCHFYRAESRGKSGARCGPPFALIQGTLGAYGTVFKDIPIEACPPIRIGSVAWVESDPEFIISLANHDEWNKAYKVSGFVVPEDGNCRENCTASNQIRGVG